MMPLTSDVGIIHTRNEEESNIQTSKLGFSLWDEFKMTETKVVSNTCGMHFNYKDRRFSEYTILIRKIEQFCSFVFLFSHYFHCLTHL